MSKGYTEAVDKLWMELAKERAHQHAECKQDEVRQVAAWCEREMGNVLDATARKITICTKSNR